MKYHFMFQFLAGNLEYLGMRLDIAYNLISILALTGFLMMLYMQGGTDHRQKRCRFSGDPVLLLSEAGRHFSDFFMSMYRREICWKYLRITLPLSDIHQTKTGGWWIIMST